MIEFRKVAFTLPVYVIGMVVASAMFNTANLGLPGTTSSVLLGAFTVAAVALFVVAGRRMFRERRVIEASGERWMVAFWVGGAAGAGVQSIVVHALSLALHTHSVWLMVPAAILGWLAGLGVMLWIASRGSASALGKLAEEWTTNARDAG